jgi:anti-anti-sigma factor
MEIKTVTQDQITIIKISGNLDSNTAPQAQEEIMPLLGANCALIVDLGECKYVSSAGLRLLCMIAKQLSTEGGQWALAGVCEEVKDVMEMTGFSGFFQTYDTVSSASKAIKEKIS